MTDTTTLPIPSASEGILSEDEKLRIEAVEDYRHEIKRRLEDKDSKAIERSLFWKEKFLAPAGIVVLTVVLSGYGIPKVLAIADKTHRASILTSDLTQEIAQQTAALQAAFDARSDAEDEFWSNASGTNAILGEFALKRDLGEMTTSEFERQDNLMENDRKRIYARLDAAVDEYGRAKRIFRPWLVRTRIRLTNLYPDASDRATAERALLTLSNEVRRGDAWLEARHKQFEKVESNQITTIKKARQRFRSHELAPEEYRRLVDAALDPLRDMTAPPIAPFAIDESAAQRVLEFVKLHEPRV